MQEHFPCHWNSCLFSYGMILYETEGESRTKLLRTDGEYRNRSRPVAVHALTGIINPCKSVKCAANEPMCREQSVCIFILMMVGLFEPCYSLGWRRSCRFSQFARKSPATIKDGSAIVRIQFSRTAGGTGRDIVNTQTMYNTPAPAYRTAPIHSHRQARIKAAISANTGI